MDQSRDTVIAVLGASVSLAGLLLVFIGFVYARAESFETKRGDAYRRAAKLGLVPFLTSLGCAWFCVEWLTGCQGAFGPVVMTFRAALIATAAYGAIALLLYH